MHEPPNTIVIITHGMFFRFGTNQCFCFHPDGYPEWIDDMSVGFYL